MLDKNIIKMISVSKGFDCSFILETTEFEELKSFFLKFFSNDILNNFDLEKITSKCFKYKNYVLKFSDFCYPEYIIKNKNIVRSYYKKNFKIANMDFVFTLGVEIQDYLEKSDEISYVELYEVYKDLRNHNILWFDVKPNNAIKNNGNLYIVDTDYIFKEDDENKICIKSELTNMFNEMYLCEKINK